MGYQVVKNFWYSAAFNNGDNIGPWETKRGRREYSVVHTAHDIGVAESSDVVRSVNTAYTTILSCSPRNRYR